MHPSTTDGIARTGATRARDGIAALVLVVVFLGALFVMTFATSIQSSTTARSHARAVLTRTSLEAAESAFTEAIAAIRQALDEGRPNPKTADDWQDLLLPPYTAGAAGRVRPERCRRVLGESHGVEISDIDVSMVNVVAVTDPRSLAAHAGVLEFKVTVKGSRAGFTSDRSVRSRYLFYCRHRPDAELVPGRRRPAPLGRDNGQAFIPGVPQGFAVDDPES